METTNRNTPSIEERQNIETPPNRRRQGDDGEDEAVDYLQKKGYRIVERNFRYGKGEIDIIAEDGPWLVFVEVKARRSTQYGEPEEAITMGKRKQIRRVALGYFFKHEIQSRECRFDVIAIKGQGKKMVIRHIENAF